jgi:hypothetical protein
VCADECHRLPFTQDLPQSWDQHWLVSTGKILTQEKLADCRTVLCVTASINRAEAGGWHPRAQGPVLVLPGRPAPLQSAQGPVVPCGLQE